MILCVKLKVVQIGFACGCTSTFEWKAVVLLIIAQVLLYKYLLLLVFILGV